MQFNENCEELGDISMKVLNESIFGRVVLNPKRGEENVMRKQPIGEEKRKVIDSILSKWEKVSAGLESIKRDILGIRGQEYATRVEAAVENLSNLIDDVVIMNGSETNQHPGPDSAPANSQNATV